MPRKADVANGFVMMPFRNDPQTQRFWNAMRRAAEQFEYLSITRFGADTLTQGSDLFGAIRQHIRHAAFCLADFTPDGGDQPNLNVLTEAGIALGADVKLYVIGRAKHYNDLVRHLPSDWNGYYIELFPPTDKGWDGLFLDFFEKIIRDLDRPTTAALEKPRTTPAAQHAWIMRVVQRLRKVCRGLYGDTTNGVNWDRKWGGFSGLPGRYVFPLQCAQAPGVTVTVGAFFDDWQRGGTPFGIEVQAPDAPATRTPLQGLAMPLTERTTEEAVEAFIAALDTTLADHTPALELPTDLARMVGGWKAHAAVLKSVCETHGDLEGSAKNQVWSADGFLMDFGVRGSRYGVTVGIDFARWRERGRTPCWIVITPREGEQSDLLGELRLPYLRALDDSGAKLVPVPTDGDFARELDSRLARVAKHCRKAAKASAAATVPDADATEEADDESLLVTRLDGDEGDHSTAEDAGDVADSGAPLPEPAGAPAMPAAIAAAAPTPTAPSTGDAQPPAASAVPAPLSPNVGQAPPTASPLDPATES